MRLLPWRGGYPLRLKDELVRLSRRDALSLGDLCEHALILGDPGAGKSTAPVRVIVTQEMKSGFGLVVFCYKNNEVERMVAMARQAGREKSLVIVEPGGFWRTNVLDWEITRSGAGASVDNATALFSEVIQNSAPGGARQSKEVIWDESSTRMMRHSMLLLMLAGRRVTLDAMKEMVDGIPDSGPGGKPIWPVDSLVRECLMQAKVAGAPGEWYRQVEAYFCREMTRPGGERFTSSVAHTFYNATDALQSSYVKELFLSDAPTFTPDFPLRGAIVVLNLPVAEYGAAGRSAQLLFKAAFVNEALRRQGLQGGRPVGMIMDEYQMFASALDAKAMQAGRESWLSVLAVTQNLPNLYSVMEPARAQHVVGSMLGTFGTVIFCRNRCDITNSWATRTLGKAMAYRANGGYSTSAGTNRGRNQSTTGSVSHSDQGYASSSGGFSVGSSWGSSSSVSYNDGWREERDSVLPEETFVSLAGGGPPKYRVESVVVKAGKQFRANGRRPFMSVVWPQR